jgi:hypothetical protein
MLTACFTRQACLLAAGIDIEWTEDFALPKVSKAKVNPQMPLYASNPG